MDIFSFHLVLLLNNWACSLHLTAQKKKKKLEWIRLIIIFLFGCLYLYPRHAVKRPEGRNFSWRPHWSHFFRHRTTNRYIFMRDLGGSRSFCMRKNYVLHNLVTALMSGVCATHKISSSIEMCGYTYIYPT